MEMVTLINTPQYFYCVGGRTGVAIAPIDLAFKNEPFSQNRVGLHHLCFRARSREDVDAIDRQRKVTGHKDTIRCYLKILMGFGLKRILFQGKGIWRM